MTMAGGNVNELERLAAELVGVKNAVALLCKNAALHLAVRLARIKGCNSV